jgi:hypothetical protein
MSLRRLQPVSRGLITHEMLARVEADLAGVQCRATATDPAAFPAANSHLAQCFVRHGTKTTRSPDDLGVGRRAKHARP